MLKNLQSVSFSSRISYQNVPEILCNFFRMSVEHLSAHDTEGIQNPALCMGPGKVEAVYEVV